MSASPAAQNVFAALLEARAGQRLGANRLWRLDTALAPMLRELGLDRLDQLALLLCGKDKETLATRVIEALLNKETSFFRDPLVFDAACSALASGERRLRIWSAGCSTGQEPFSIAMSLVERGSAAPQVVATDVSAAGLARARAGRFSHFEVQRGLSVQRLVRWFEPAAEDWMVRPALAGLVSFQQNNLAADHAPSGPFDAVFCRNVLLYLTPAARMRAFDSFVVALRPGGLLVLGAGETVIGQSDAFRPSQRFRGLYELANRHAVAA